jgi:membrane fusion protein (multidrug efflux system)
MTDIQKEAKLTNTTEHPPLKEAAPEPIVQPPAVKNNRSRYLWLFTFLLIIIGAAWFLLWFFYLQFHVRTDDAYSNGSIVPLNSVIPGSVIAFYADDTDLVLEGQLLAELDKTYYQIEYEKTLATLAAQTLRIKQSAEDVFTAQANVEVRKSLLSKARFDYENRSQLVDSKAISKEDFIHSRDDLTIAENELKKAESQLKSAQDIIGNGPLETHPLIEEKKADVREAYFNLTHCSLYAPATGHVAKRGVNVGQAINRTTDLMGIIPTDYVWVDANYKETELTHMRVGQPATVTFDMYGSDVVYEGKVLGIASGSGSVFSLIPPQNATGNWIKIVQRLPVRISLDPEVVKNFPVRLGISADVKVNITNRDLPMLTQVPPTKPVATTNVFEIHLKNINEIIDQIVQSNLSANPAKEGTMADIS